MKYPSPIELDDGELLTLALAGPAFGDPRLPQRFWAKISVDNATGCWLWTACAMARGYGKFKVAGEVQYAHRIAYAALVAELPPSKSGMQADHLCRRPSCANPSHLEVVTGRVNIARSSGIRAASVRTKMITGRCIRGHADWESKPEGSGMRCRACYRGDRNNAA